MTKIIKFVGLKNGDLTVITTFWPMPLHPIRKVFVLCNNCGVKSWMSYKDFKRRTACTCKPHANTKHGQSKTLLYSKWTGMKQRTLNSNQQNYRYYGGRGIKVCGIWLDDFESFYTYVISTIGMPKPGDEIERINSNGDYAPGNIKWARRIEQMNNTNRNNKINYKGKAYTITYLYELLKPVVPRDAFRSRITKHKWDIDRAATTPMNDNMQRLKGTEIKLFYLGDSYTITELIEKFKPCVNERTFRKRLRSGWSISDALRTPVDLSRSRT